MRRRDFLRALISAGIYSGLAPGAAWAENWPLAEILSTKAIKTPYVDKTAQKPLTDRDIKDYLLKMKDFDRPHDGDVMLEEAKVPLLTASLGRLHRLQRLIGHGNFHILSFDEALRYAKNFSRVGEFPKEEVDFLELLFYEDAARLGFLGEKPITSLTDQIRTKETVKPSGTGNYLYKGRPVEVYEKIKKEIGNEVYLTSGIRSVMKQFLLFLDKAQESNGNLSLASRSLAPPGYSFHGIADFDVGQKGLGALNFTNKFAETEVFKRLQDLNLVTLRYPDGNLLGVRFEPWHIKVYS